MNKTLTLLLLCLFIAGCGGGDDKGSSEPPTPPTPQGSITLTGECASGLVFTSDGGSKDITFTTDGGDWTASLTGNSVNWCKISPTSGSGTAVTVRVTVEANEGYDERTAVVQLSRGSAKKTVKITQKQKNALLVSSNNIGIDRDGEDFTVTVKSNISFTYQIPQQFSSWLKEGSGSRALSERTLTFHADKNFDLQGREGYIVFSGDGVEETVYITQGGGSRMVLSSTEQNISASGGQFSIEINSNCDFTVSSPSVSWLRILDSRAMSSHTIYFEADEYDSTDAPRQTTVTITSVDGDVSETVTITQHEKGEIILGDTEVEARASASSMSIDIEANIEVGIKIPEETKSWVRVTVDKVSRSRAMTARKVYIELTPNTTNEPRQATVTIYDLNDPAFEKVVTIDQQPIYFKVISTNLNEGDFNDAKSHEIELGFATNADSLLLTCATNIIPTLNISVIQNDTICWVFRGILSENATPKTSRKQYVRIQLPPGWNRVYSYKVAEIAIYQDAPKITASQTEYRTTSLGTTFKPSIKANIGYTLEVDKDAQSWVSLSNKNLDYQNPDYSITLKPNTTTESRKAVITAKASNPDINASFTIIQTGADPTAPKSETFNLTQDIRLSSLLTTDMMTTLESMTITGVLKARDWEVITEMVKQDTLRYLDLTQATTTADPVNNYWFPLNGRAFSFEDERGIPSSMFESSKLITLKIPENTTTIGSSAFRYTRFKNMTLPASVTQIGKYAFAWAQINRLDMSNATGITSLPDYFLSNCVDLEEIILPPSLSVIGTGAFSCTNYDSDYDIPRKLKSITLPESMRKIGEQAFYHNGLTSIMLPAGITEIGKKAFKWNTLLTSATIKCVTSDKILPEEMFFYCFSLNHVEIAQGYTEIGARAFVSTGSIVDLAIPSGVTKIGENAFSSSGIKSITLPEGLTEICEQAFYQCRQLTHLTIPSTVTTIGSDAFNTDRGGLLELHLKMTTLPKLEGDLFNSDFDFKSCRLYVPKGCKEMYQNAPQWSRFTNIIEE